MVHWMVDGQKRLLDNFSFVSPAWMLLELFYRAALFESETKNPRL